MLAGNRIFQRYGTLTKSLYALHDHMMKSTETLRKNGHILHPGDFFDDQYFQNAVSQGVAPIFRGLNPTPQMVSGLPYNDDEVPGILPKFRKDVAEGRIFLIGRDILNTEDLFISRTTTTSGKKTPIEQFRTIAAFRGMVDK